MPLQPSPFLGLYCAWWQSQSLWPSWLELEKIRKNLRNERNDWAQPPMQTRVPCIQTLSPTTWVQELLAVTTFSCSMKIMLILTQQRTIMIRTIEEYVYNTHSNEQWNNELIDLFQCMDHSVFGYSSTIIYIGYSFCSTVPWKQWTDWHMNTIYLYQYYDSTWAHNVFEYSNIIIYKKKSLSMIDYFNIFYIT